MARSGAGVDLTHEWLSLATRMFTSLRTAVLLGDVEQAKGYAAVLAKTLESTYEMATARQDNACGASP
jgi:hypothetical protein